MKKIFFILFFISAIAKAQDFPTRVNATVYADTGTIATNLATRGALNKSIDSVQANVNLRVKYTDTSAMLANYLTGLIATGARVKYTDTSAMLANYLTGLIATAVKVKYSDTAAMLSAYLTQIIANTSAIAGKATSLTIAADATDADFSIAINSVKYLPAATLSQNRTITFPAGSNGDYIEIYNNEAGFVWLLGGGAVYLSNGVTTVASLLANTNYIIRKVSGKWRVAN